MRKDVKLGLAIGAIFLAVIIVYAAGGRHSPKKSAEPVVINTQAPPDNTDQGSKPVDVPPPAPPVDSHTVQPAPGIGSGATVTDNSAPKPPAGNKPLDWATLLSASDTQLHDLMPTHPAAAAPQTLPPDHSPMPADMGDSDPGSLIQHGGAMADNSLSGSTTRPAASATPRTHTVQSGETLAAIAKSIYGKPNMYLAIEKANPSVNPNRLKVGTVLTLPAASSSSSSSDEAVPVIPTHHSHPADAAIDSTKEYKVRPGDSLQKIAQKLYGNAARADELYTTNKDTIGDDPAKLKVGEVLKLPEPPSSSASH
jgi:nucleoid-associated protein YgaU